MPEDASPDRDARRIVPERLASWGGQGLPPVPGTPGAGRRVDRDDRHSLCGVRAELRVCTGGFHMLDDAAPTAALSTAAPTVRTAWGRRTLGA
ncbi:hypothetical protein [Streptomyces sp. 2A115]|uniref:hypothetical protein n=1 Tax=Streptomyces sp. 2A115 TaxID=3457439 RepID=UPI003FD68A08